jgi:hypothetical protein
MRKDKFQVRGREGNTYMLMTHFTGGGDGAAASRCHGQSGGYNNVRVETSAGTVRATSGLKPPSSRVYWLSESGEPSYELEYAAEGPGGGRLVEFMPLS